MSRRFAAFAILMTATLCAGCSQSVWIVSQPSRAQVYIDGEFKGETPFLVRPTYHLFASMDIRLVKPGFEEINANVAVSTMSVINIIASIPIVTMLWTWQYRDEYVFDLTPVPNAPDATLPEETPTPAPEPSATPEPSETPEASPEPSETPEASPEPSNSPVG